MLPSIAGLGLIVMETGLEFGGVWGFRALMAGCGVGA